LEEGLFIFFSISLLGPLKKPLSFPRECPAKYLAVELAWGAIANILWAFNVDSPTSKEIDQKIDIFGRSAWLDGVNM